MDIAKEFSEIDFSVGSRIKDSLFEKLMQNRLASVADMSDYEMDMEELDYVAAAGNENVGIKPDNKDFIQK